MHVVKVATLWQFREAAVNMFLFEKWKLQDFPMKRFYILDSHPLVPFYPGIIDET